MSSWGHIGIIGRLTDLLQYSATTPPISRPGCWAYPDMMEVGNLKGMTGPGKNISIGVNESRSHFGAVSESCPLSQMMPGSFFPSHLY